MKQKNETKSFTQNGITLIALVITIIVLLILAGVTINAIVGNDSSMEKAQRAKTENEKADELDTIKLAVVDSVSKGTTGYIVETELASSLQGIVDNPETITEDDAPWMVKGSITGNYYTITQNGQVELVKGVSFKSKQVKVKQGKSTEVEVINITGEELSISPTSSNGITVTKGNDNKVTIAAASTAEIGTKVTITATAGEESDTCEVEVIDSPKRGDYIILNSRAITGVGPANTDNTSNTSNADDWMILYNGMDETQDDDEKGLFIIMSNYLPNAYKANDSDESGVAKMAGLTYSEGAKATYGVSIGDGESRLDLINKLKPTDETDANQRKASRAWKSLISNDIITTYPTTKVYGALDMEMMKKLVGTKNNGSLNYYVPWSSKYLGCQGYRLASLFEYTEVHMYYVRYDTTIQTCGVSGDSVAGLCPIVILPQNVQLKKNINGVWEVVIP